MFYSIDNGCITPLQTAGSENGEHHLGVLAFEELYAAAGETDRSDNKKQQADFQDITPRFERHDGYNLLCLKVPEWSSVLPTCHNIFIYIRESLLLFIAKEPKELDQFIALIAEEAKNLEDKMDFGRFLCIFIDRIFIDDRPYLQKLEQFFEQQKYAVSLKKTAELYPLQEKLLQLKRYSESSYQALTSFYENENGILNDLSIRILKIRAAQKFSLLKDSELLLSRLRALSYELERQEKTQHYKTVQAFSLYCIAIPIFIAGIVCLSWFRSELLHIAGTWGFVAIFIAWTLLFTFILFLINRKKHSAIHVQYKRKE